MMLETLTATDEPAASRPAPPLRRLPQDPRVRFYLSLPDSAAGRAPVFVTVHGISRNALEHAQLFAPFARAAGMALLAPVFDEATFGKYQRLAPRRPGPLRTDETLLRILDHLACAEGLDGGRVNLFGFSGGGQYAHRFAMLHPDRVHATVVGAAGWYTMPDPEVAYPYGIGQPNRPPLLRFEPERFLRNPFHVVVGSRDLSRDWALRKSERLDLQQGLTRLERGRRWIEAMKTLAASLDMQDARLGFEELPGARHSFGKAMTRRGLGEAVFGALAPARVPPAAASVARQPA
jgi:pimeloyl-ACP methyl ester carboxylesterase